MTWRAGRAWRTAVGALRRLWRSTRPAPGLVCASVGLRTLHVPVAIASPFLTRHLFDHALPGGRTDELLVVGLGLVLVALIAASLNQGYELLAIRLRSQARARFGRRLFAHVARLPLSFFSTRDSGYLTSRLREDLCTIDRLSPDALLAAVADVVRMVCFLAILLTLDAGLALAALLLLGVLTTVLARLSRPLRARYQTALEASAQSASTLTELIRGLTVLRTLGAAERQTRRCGRAQLASLRADAARDRLQASTMNILSLGGQIGMAVILIAGAYRMLAAEATFGTLVASFVALGQLIGAAESVTSYLPRLLAGLAGLARIHEVLDHPIEVTLGGDIVPAERAQGHLELDRVGFSYDSSVPVLREISFSVRPGETVALVGRSGAGKSTLAHLVAGLYPPSAGEVRLDGRPLATYRSSWLTRQLSLVTQHPFLIDGTIRDNLRLGRPHAPETDVRRAARWAAADRFIDPLPEGYDTVVGEGGTRLSGGQRQRLALARALLCDPPVLILDEATSSLDAESEATVSKAIVRLMRGRTCIVIAHRRTTLRLAQRIVVLDGGRIVDHGTHEALMQRPGLYRHLVTLDAGTTVAAPGSHDGGRCATASR